MGRTNIHLVTDFLGAGETTIINNLLGQKDPKENWAVIICEFGNISIDSMNLSEITSSNAKIHEIMGGCICCSSKELFEQHLHYILNDQQPDRVLPEHTGWVGADMELLATKIVNRKSSIMRLCMFVYIIR